MAKEKIIIKEVDSIEAIRKELRKKGYTARPSNSEPNTVEIEDKIEKQKFQKIINSLPSKVKANKKFRIEGKEKND